MKGCWSCKHQDSNRGFCWHPERIHKDDDGPAFSEITQTRENEEDYDAMVCKYHEHPAEGA